VLGERKTENGVGRDQNYTIRTRSSDSLNSGTSLPPVSPKFLDPCVLSWPGVRRCFAIQWLRPFLRVLDIHDQASLVAGRVHSFDTWTRWTLKPYAVTSRSSVCGGCCLWCFGLCEATSQATGCARQSLTHGPLSTFRNDEEHYAGN
jgi:hypothetical protein